MNSFPGLSILIPIYNFDVLALVKELQKQVSGLGIEYEIRCYDDASDAAELKEGNRKLDEIEGVVYTEFKENKGRSMIRNLLAQESNYDLLLFIDSDSKIVDDTFIEKYLHAANDCDVVAGGTTYSDEHSDMYSLRLKYGKQREELNASSRSEKPYSNISLNNLLIHKQVFLKHLLDEQILKYGHEDTKFAFSLKQAEVNICHIDNPVEHIGLEENAVFLSKTEDGVANFLYLIKQGYVQETKLFKAYRLLQKLKLSGLFLAGFALYRKTLQKNLLSASPNLLLFDLYKLQLLIRFSRKKH